MRVVIASNKKWHKNLADKMSSFAEVEIMYVDSANADIWEQVFIFSPQWVFFLHWSNYIPKKIYNSLRCVVFHMTDLPFGRGGSPLQNLIVRGYTETKLSAIQCVKELDAGDIYLKRNLSLLGTAEEIFLRASRLMLEMMTEIIQNDIVPIPQSGEPVIFKRRKPEDGNLSCLESLQDVFDYIRMLDAEGYPRAFLDIGKLRIEFDRASLKDGYIVADAKITMRDEG